MADAKIVDIKGVQWELKDEVARNSIAEINTTLKNQQTDIEQLSKKSYINNIIFNFNPTITVKWFKIDGLFGNEHYENNVFALTSRDGEYHEIFCGTTNGSVPVKPFWIRYYQGTGKINAIKFKNNSIWIQVLGYSALRIQQIIGTPIIISLSEEDPPDDAIDIGVKQVTLS